MQYIFPNSDPIKGNKGNIIIRQDPNSEDSNSDPIIENIIIVRKEQELNLKEDTGSTSWNSLAPEIFMKIIQYCIKGENNSPPDSDPIVGNIIIRQEGTRAKP